MPVSRQSALRKPVSRKTALILCALLGVLLLIGWLAWRVLHSPPPIAPPPPQLTRDGALLHVRPGSTLQKILRVQPVPVLALPRQIALPAQIVSAPGKSVTVYAPVTGRIVALRVHAGQKVKQGEVLALMVSGEAALAVADQRKAQAALTLAQAAYQRAKGVLAAGGNAVKDMQSARADLETAQAEAWRAQIRLTTLGLPAPGVEPQYFPITAPVSGVVGNVLTAFGQNVVGMGQNVTDMSVPLMTVTALDDVLVSASAPQDLIGAFRPDMTLTADFGTQRCTGPVTSQDPALGEDTRRLNLYLRCPNPRGELHPGAFTTASLSVPERMQAMLPKTALLMSNDLVTVFLEVAPDTYRRQNVTVSYDEGDDVRVVSGVKKGERVVTRGAILLNDY